MLSISVWLPVVASLVPFVATVCVLWLWVKKKDLSGRRNPLTRDLLRAPGESLRERISDINFDVAAFFALSPLPLIYIYAAAMSEKAFSGHWPPLRVIVLDGIAAAGMLSWIWWRLWTLLRTRRFLTLGYEAELAVGQELNQLLSQGFHVFHDVAGREFNIDHVVIGSTGVFAVETKGRSKPGARQDASESQKVMYDGASLQFPGWIETKPLQQAQMQANWLQEWLSSAIGEGVAVQPVLVLPGWYIERTSGHGMPVLPGANLQKYFEKPKGETRLDEIHINRIAHQLDRRCRTVAPRAYAKDRRVA